jgi:dolichyldiphosphatase
VDKATSEAWEQSGGLGTVTALWEIASWELAKRTRVLISLIAAFTLIYRHDALAIMTLAGAIANALLGKVLKRIIKEERPPGAPVSDPGMPSSHANSIFFFFSFLAGVPCTALARCSCRFCTAFPIAF